MNVVDRIRTLLSDNRNTYSKVPAVTAWFWVSDLGMSAALGGAWTWELVRHLQRGGA